MINYLLIIFQKSTWSNYFSSRKMFKAIHPLTHILYTLDLLMFNSILFGVIMLSNGSLISFICAPIIWYCALWLYLNTVSNFPKTIHWIKNYLEFTLREIHEEKM